MDLKDRYALSDVINAAGTFTPVGVSRSAPSIAAAAAEALGRHFIIDELQEAANAALQSWSGAEAGAVTHCAASGITVAIAAAMAGDAPEAVAALPCTDGLDSRVVLPAGHAVNYGQPITQAVRLAGATPVLAGDDAGCTLEALTEALCTPGTACLLLVSSRLVRGASVDLAAAVAAAHGAGVPAIIDGAAQDMRIAELVGTGADAVIISAQKYLASPTAGLVVGKAKLIKAVRAQEKGIGRGMKASKEALCGVLAALEERARFDIAAWSREQTEKVNWLKGRLEGLPGVRAEAVMDPAGLPMPRLQLALAPEEAGMDAAALRDRLKAGSPSVWVIDRMAAEGLLLLELEQLGKAELKLLSEIISGLVTQG